MFVLKHSKLRCLLKNCPGDAGKIVGDSLFIVRAMRQERITVPVIGGSAGYVIPDFEKALGEFAEAVFSISPTNYDLAPALTDKFRKRFGYFMAHEAIEQAVALDVLVQAIERAKSGEPEKR